MAQTIFFLHDYHLYLIQLHLVIFIILEYLNFVDLRFTKVYFFYLSIQFKAHYFIVFNQMIVIKKFSITQTLVSLLKFY